MATNESTDASADAQATNDEIPEWLAGEDDDLSLGTREDAMVNTSQTEREWVKTSDGKVYWFDVKEISWEKKNQILDNNLDMDEQSGEVDLDLTGFYRDMMRTVIVDASVGSESIAVFLKGVKPELGDKLQQIVPQPGAVLDDDTEGNSEAQ